MNDCRYYRARGVPSVVFGSTVFNEAAADEYTLVEDLVKVTKAHTGTIIDHQTMRVLTTLVRTCSCSVNMYAISS